MKTLIVTDKDSKTELSEDLLVRLHRLLTDQGLEIDSIDVGRDEILPCRGCLLCLTRNNGQCVLKDLATDYRRRIDEYCAVFVITPIVFGQLPSHIKNVVDRGVYSHKLHVTIGNGTDATEEERSTFRDIIVKHQGAADIVHPGLFNEVQVHITDSPEDNVTICGRIGRSL